ncbi:MAG TPA: GNAT family N-acetyltransferase [Ktedonobacteraceae bacterium]|jgi:ribosomal protein S18 acetylase RimI-like enzyme
MLSLLSLQEYLRFKARQHHEVISSSPFTIFFHPTDASPESNYAIPDVVGDSGLQDSLVRLPSIFTERARKPRLQFIDDESSHLLSVLPSCGWTQEEQSQVMICTPEICRPAPTIPGLAIATLSYESSVEKIREGLDTNALGFDPQAEASTIHEAEEFRSSLMLSRAFTAYLHAQPVGAGMFTDIHEGLTELVGITTLEPFRRQGIAAALTAYMAQSAFQQGAALVFLIAANAQAGRVYERVGFHPYATRVVYESSASSV